MMFASLAKLVNKLALLLIIATFSTTVATSEPLTLPAGFSMVDIEVQPIKEIVEGWNPPMTLSLTETEVGRSGQRKVLVDCARVLSRQASEGRQCGPQLKLLLRSADREKLVGLEQGCQLQAEVKVCSLQPKTDRIGVGSLPSKKVTN